MATKASQSRETGLDGIGADFFGIHGIGAPSRPCAPRRRRSRHSSRHSSRLGGEYFRNFRSPALLEGLGFQWTTLKLNTELKQLAAVRGSGTSVSRGWYFRVQGLVLPVGSLLVQQRVWLSLCLWLSPLPLAVSSAFGCLPCRWLSLLPLVVFSAVGCLLPLVAFAFSPLRFGGLPLPLRLCAVAGSLRFCALPCLRLCPWAVAFAPVVVAFAFAPLRLCAVVGCLRLCAFAPLRLLLLCRWAVACAFALRWCAFACCVSSCFPWFAWGLSLLLCRWVLPLPLLLLAAAVAFAP